MDGSSTAAATVILARGRYNHYSVAVLLLLSLRRRGPSQCSSSAGSARSRPRRLCSIAHDADEHTVHSIQQTHKYPIAYPNINPHIRDRCVCKQIKYIVTYVIGPLSDGRNIGGAKMHHIMLRTSNSGPSNLRSAVGVVVVRGGAGYLWKKNPALAGSIPSFNNFCCCCCCRCHHHSCGAAVGVPPGSESMPGMGSCDCCCCRRQPCRPPPSSSIHRSLSPIHIIIISALLLLLCCCCAVLLLLLRSAERKIYAHHELIIAVLLLSPLR